MHMSKPPAKQQAFWEQKLREKPRQQRQGRPIEKMPKRDASRSWQKLDHMAREAQQRWREQYERERADRGES